MQNGTEKLPLRILVIQPDPLCPMERFDGWMESESTHFSIVEPSKNDKIPETLDGYDGLIVLGGEMGDGDDDQYPWLKQIRSLLNVATKQDQPVLGVCLGAQLLASATGGKVERGSEGLEAGIVDVERMPGFDSDMLLKGMENNFQSAAMHQDAIIDLPQNAELLATGSMYPNQAYRINSSWGVQFHPELSPERFFIWLEETTKPGSEARELMQKGYEKFLEEDEVVYDANRVLANNFLEIVSQKKQQSLTAEK